jgi:cytochrome oxidase assembly protein ShyY1
VYRFLLTPRWLGLAALTLCLAAVMVLAGHWQLERYHERSATNARIDASGTAAPLPIEEAMPAPRGEVGTAGPAAAPGAQFSRVRMTGRYDPEREILARGRTLGGKVGFEVLTPVVLDGGAAVLVDRGWIPAGPDAGARPDVPEPPAGAVSITGRLARTESGAARLVRQDGRIEVRRVALPRLAAELPYPVYGSYVLLDPDQPGGEALAAVPSRRENAWQNAGYVVQWWLFAAMTLAAYPWLARREANGPQAEDDRAAGPADRPADGPADRAVTAR